MVTQASNDFQTYQELFRYLVCRSGHDADRVLLWNAHLAQGRRKPVPPAACKTAVEGQCHHPASQWASCCRPTCTALEWCTALVSWKLDTAQPTRRKLPNS